MKLATVGRDGHSNLDDAKEQSNSFHNEVAVGQEIRRQASARNRWKAAIQSASVGRFEILIEEPDIGFGGIDPVLLAQEPMTLVREYQIFDRNFVGLYGSHDLVAFDLEDAWIILALHYQHWPNDVLGME